MSDTLEADLPTSTTRLTGWGRTAPTTAQVLSTPDVDLIAKAVAAVADHNADSPSHLKRGIVARGLGRSYGDVAQNAGGIVVDMTPLDTIHSIDPDAATVDVDAGVSLDALMRAALPTASGCRFCPEPARSPSAARSGATCTARTTTAPARSATTSLDAAAGRGRTRPHHHSGRLPDDPDGTLFWATSAASGSPASSCASC